LMETPSSIVGWMSIKMW